MADCISFAARQAGINPATVFLGAAFAIPKDKKAIFNKNLKECQDCKKMIDSQLNGFGYSFTQNAKNACEAVKKPISGCDYVENWNAGGDQYSIQRFKIDCDPSKGIGSSMLQEQKDTLAKNQNDANAQLKTLVGAFLMIAIVVFVFIYLNNHPSNGNS